MSGPSTATAAIEHPLDSQRVWALDGRSVYVDGWVLLPGMIQPAVRLRVNGEMHHAESGLARPDVAAAFPDIAGSNLSGFACVVPTGADALSIEVEARRADGEWTVCASKVVAIAHGRRAHGLPTTEGELSKETEAPSKVRGWLSTSDPNASQRGIVVIDGRPGLTVEPTGRFVAGGNAVHLFEADILQAAEPGTTLTFVAVSDDVCVVVDEVATPEAPETVVELEESVPLPEEIRLPFEGWFGEPRSNSVERVAVPVSGWVAVDGAMASTAHVVVEGREFLARLGICTMALSDAIESDAVAVGFEAMVDFASFPENIDEVSISVRATGLRGKTTVVRGPRVTLLSSASSDVEELGDVEELSRLTSGRRRLGCDLAPLASRASARSKRILVYTHDLGLGGGQLYVWELLERLAELHAYEITMVAERGGALMERAEARGWKTHVTPTASAADPWAFEGHLEELAHWVAARSFDAVIVNSLGSFLGVEVAALLGLPSLWALHESFPLNVFEVYKWGSGVAHPWVRERLRASLGAADRLIFEAAATRAMFEQYTDPQRAITVPYGIQLAGIDQYRTDTDRDALRDSLGFAPDEHVILVMGTTEPRKAQAVIMRAFVELTEQFPDARLVIVGDTGGEYGAAVRALAERHGVEDRTTVVGIVSDTYQYYLAADLLVTASDIESLPRSVLEAMAFGLPVLATRIFGLPELITDTVTGWLCEPSDMRALIERLRDVLSLSDAERHDVGARGQAHVHEHYDSTGYARTYDTLLTELIGSPAAGDASAGVTATR